MQPVPPPVSLGPARRARAIAFVLVGGLLIFVGTPLQYAWSLLFVFEFPNLTAPGSTVDLLAGIAGTVGGVLEAIGFLLVFYGISVVLEGLLLSRAGFFSGPAIPGGAVLTGSVVPRSHPSTSPLIMAGAGLVFLGGTVASLIWLLDLVEPSSIDVFRLEIGIGFTGGLLAAAGFGLAFYGIAMTIRRLI